MKFREPNGGSDRVSYLQLTYRECNRGRRDLISYDFQRKMSHAFPV